ncbi:hypothetical protein QYE76_034728 [Lolium multiflorum]|uniref:Non-haem dioxygenase N-terminal domain-containing protein n=1 Tax=Lolium multiflorum TaxID=4521 RepID=A0AAD8QXN8_LOLMU|nr:hypothetical protein QYE76_034728 [Lolium multiflorum]
MLDLRWTVEDDLVLLHRVVPCVDVAFITTCIESLVNHRAGNMEGTTKKEASSELIVQELAGVVPAHYVMPPQDRPSAVAAAAPIPVIDLGRLSGPNADGQEAAKLRLALETWGFLKVPSSPQLNGVDGQIPGAGSDRDSSPPQAEDLTGDDVASEVDTLGEGRSYLGGGVVASRYDDMSVVGACLLSGDHQVQLRVARA